MKKHLITKGIIGLAIIAIVFFSIITALMPKVKAETPVIDPEKTFLQTFSQNGIKQYQLTDFQKFAVWVDGNNIYNVAGETNGNWTIISRMQLPATTPTPTP